jgi:uncharacterized membrane protein YidH (DUF202 family)
MLVRPRTSGLGWGIFVIAIGLIGFGFALFSTDQGLWTSDNPELLRHDYKVLTYICAIVILVSSVSAFLLRQKVVNAQEGRSKTSAAVDGFMFAYLLIFIIGPIFLLAFDNGFGPYLFTNSCDNPRGRDYYWYVFDNIVKGAILDLFQSYHINFWTCEPDKTKIVSSVSFFIRSVVTYVLILLAVQSWSGLRKQTAPSKIDDQEPKQSRIRGRRVSLRSKPRVITANRDSTIGGR